MSETREVAEVAQALGMKEREIVHVTRPMRDPRLGRDGRPGVLVKLHDDSVVFLADDGRVVHPVDFQHYVLVDAELDEDQDDDVEPDVEDQAQVDGGENAGDSTPAEQVVSPVVVEQHEGQAVTAAAVDAGENEGQGAELEPVPDGSAEVVLAWVGQDADRARRALQAEGGREKPRVGVTNKLRELLSGGADE